MTSLDPASGEAAAPTRRPSPQAQPTGDRVNPLITATLDIDQTTDQTTGQITGPCLCHDAADCPDQATVTITVGELARVIELLTDIDQFLRCGNGAAEQLADFYARRGDCSPRFAAANLIDAVGFTALGLRGVGTAADQEADAEGADR